MAVCTLTATTTTAKRVPNSLNGLTFAKDTALPPDLAGPPSLLLPEPPGYGFIPAVNHHVLGLPPDVGDRAEDSLKPSEVLVRGGPLEVPYLGSDGFLRELVDLRYQLPEPSDGDSLEGEVRLRGSPLHVDVEIGLGDL